jgi:uncharacterized protein with HEPN domain
VSSDAERLRDIRESITVIGDHTAGGRNRFDDNVVLRTARRSRQTTSLELRSHRAEVDWPGIIAMRNRLTHGYFEIEADLVWAVVADHLPTLRRQVEAILRELE